MKQMTGLEKLGIVLLLSGCAVAYAQSGGQQDSNPFPEAGQQASPQNPPKQSQPTEQKPGNNAPGANGNSPEQNPFPGEDSNAPVIPVEPQGGTAAPSHATPSPTVSDIDPDGDPVRTPEWSNADPATTAANQDFAKGFSSSNSGLQDWNTPDASSSSGKKKRGQQNEEAVQTPGQRLKEDLSVGSFYLDQKNWSAAQSRFAEAFRMNPEEIKALWGLAISEEHLQMYSKARQHFELYLSYGMDGRQAKEARKALKEMPQTGNAQNR
jgi:tetratricopeptide (TPR) repeat protein